jgi:ABC-type antimicrobial peptide transport system permease subunit
MGASRLRIFRLVMTESILLSLLGGALGVLFAWWGADLMIALAPPGFSAVIGIRALSFALVISVASGILFGLPPALDSMRGNVPELVSGAPPRLQLLRGASLLAIAQVGLACSLLIGAGLMIDRGQDRFETVLLAVFAVITLLLAMAGVYAVLHRAVDRRSREISIRMALGARGGEVASMVLREAALLVGAGSCVGLITGVFASRVLSGGIRAADANILLIVSGILILAAAPASYFPARAASKIEPRLALKRD